MLPEYLIAVDLGQVSDPTAVAVVEQREAPTGRTEVVSLFAAPPDDNWTARLVERPQVAAVFDIVHLERLPLGTSYVEVPGRIRALEAAVRAAWQRAAWAEDARGGHGSPARRLEDAPVTLLMDGTGVGRPVLDLMREAGLIPVAVTIHGGDRVVRVAEDEWRVPKRTLVGSVQAAMQARRLKAAADLPEWPALRRELQGFKARISLSGHDSYGAGGGAEEWRGGGPHDDLVLAVAMATWWGEKERAGAGALVMR